MSANRQATIGRRWGQIKPSHWSQFRPSFPEAVRKLPHDRREPEEREEDASRAESQGYLMTGRFPMSVVSHLRSSPRQGVVLLQFAQCVVDMRAGASRVTASAALDDQELPRMRADNAVSREMRALLD